MKTDALTEILGYKPNAELKRIILMAVKTTGRTIEDVASDYAMPEICVCDPDNTFEYKDRRYTKDTFRAAFPYRKIIIIKTDD
jgi:hypothetical protein